MNTVDTITKQALLDKWYEIAFPYEAELEVCFKTIMKLYNFSGGKAPADTPPRYVSSRTATAAAAVLRYTRDGGLTNFSFRWLSCILYRIVSGIVIKLHSFR